LTQRYIISSGHTMYTSQLCCASTNASIQCC